MEEIKEKKCGSCKQIKDFTQFYNSKQTKGGKRCYCILCEKEKNAKREPQYKNQRKKYRQTEHYKQLKRNYYNNNKEKVLNGNKQWRVGKAGKLFSYKKAAEVRNINWNLTEEEFFSLWNKPCSYCGKQIKTIGIDRIDNNKGYTVNNICSCCSLCNKMKMNLNKNVFINHVLKIGNFINENT